MNEIMAKKLVSIVIPVLNEEGNLPVLYERLSAVLKNLATDYELLFINDGSSDQSLLLLKTFADRDAHIKIIDFSRNFGHQLAVTAGLDHCHGDCAVIIDADLQDPPELITELITKWNAGYQVVYAQRVKRKGEHFIKVFTAMIFYRLLKKLANIEIPLDTGDFRLIDRKVIESLKAMPERNRFIRGMVSWIGLRQTSVQYVREERLSGKTKYPLFKMIRFALTGLTSFSLVPLQLSSLFGFLVSGISFLAGLYTIYLKIFTTRTIPGWTSLMIALLFLGGIQLITLGIIGEYVGRISEEVKQRPAYIIQDKINL
jgi:glycosyltransferase involved in cell wall biosynthesis